MAWTTPATVVADSTELTAALWNEQVRDNTNALYESVRRLGYQTRTTNYTTASTNFASAADVFSTAITFTADGTSAYRFYLYLPGVQVPAGRAFYACLGLNGTQYGRTGAFYGPAGQLEVGGVSFERWLVPSAGSVSVNFRFRHDTGACIAVAGTGVSDAPVPMFMSVYGPALT